MQFSTLTKTAGLFFGTIALSGLTTSCNHTMPMGNNTASPTASPMGGMDHSQMGGSNMGSMSHSSMDLGKADADYDLRFIDGMAPHHEGAIVMAKAVLAKSQRPELKKLAEAIIQGQTAEISQMQKWRSAWYPKAPATPMAWNSQMNHMMPMEPEQAKAMRMDMDLGAADAKFDQRFLDAMIPHHEGAIVMAQDALAKSQRPEIQNLAKAIIADQQIEIDQMKQWQKTWYGKS
jgi:uncharacterized protein (DUF305 family)